MEISEEKSVNVKKLWQSMHIDDSDETSANVNDKEDVEMEIETPINKIKEELVVNPTNKIEIVKPIHKTEEIIVKKASNNKMEIANPINHDTFQQRKAIKEKLKLEW